MAKDGFDNPYLDFLELSREGQLGTFRNAASKFQKRARTNFDLNSLFDEARNEFSAELAGQALGGGAPTRLFTDFVKDGGFDLASRLARTSGLRAIRDTQNNPKTRFIFGG